MNQDAPGELTARRTKHQHLPDDAKDGEVNLGLQTITMIVRDVGDIAVGIQKDVRVTVVVRYPLGDVPALIHRIEMMSRRGTGNVHRRPRTTRITLPRAGRHIPRRMITLLNRTENQSIQRPSYAVKLNARLKVQWKKTLPIQTPSLVVVPAVDLLLQTLNLPNVLLVTPPQSQIALPAAPRAKPLFHSRYCRRRLPTNSPRKWTGTFMSLMILV